MSNPAHRNAPSQFQAPKGAVQRATKIPLFVSVALVLSGTALIFILDGNNLASSFSAYLLASLGPASCLGWDSVSQRRGMKSANFSPNRGLTKSLQFLAVAGVLVATIHIFKISELLAEILTELFGLI